ncbi:MAG: Mov34/MPN/PAD-1 family protein [Prochlorothrix sp.]
MAAVSKHPLKVPAYFAIPSTPPKGRSRKIRPIPVRLPFPMLTLTADQYRSIAIHAAQTYPEECCGLLLGTQHQNPADHQNQPQKICREVWPTANVWVVTDEELLQGSPEQTSAEQAWHTGKRNPDRHDRFTIDPRDLLQAQRYSRDRNWGIIGVYHSHPDHPAHPSERDRVAAWSHYSYLILSVAQGNTVDYRSWILDDQHQFQSEAVVVTPDP